MKKEHKALLQAIQAQSVPAVRIALKDVTVIEWLEPFHQCIVTALPRSGGEVVASDQTKKNQCDILQLLMEKQSLLPQGFAMLLLTAYNEKRQDLFNVLYPCAPNVAPPNWAQTDPMRWGKMMQEAQIMHDRHTLDEAVGDIVSSKSPSSIKRM